MGSIIRRFVSTNGASASPHTAQGTEIHWMSAGCMAPEVIAGVPSVHAAWNGSYSLCVDGRSLKLEDEVFLALNAGHVLTPRGRRDSGGCLLSIYFAPQLLSQAFASLAAGDRELLLPGMQNGALRLFEHLRDWDRSLTSVMHYVAHHICAGVEDPQWYEEQVSFLLRRLLTHEISLARTVDNMTHMKSWKRRETFTRLARVTDLIHSCYHRALSIDELAEAAHWSRFHMMREFKAVHGISPYECLQRRRTQTAARLLCSTEFSVAEIAERTGFHERSTLMRRLHRSRGLGARALRMLAHDAQTGSSPQTLPHRMPTSAASGLNPATSISS